MSRDRSKSRKRTLSRRPGPGVTVPGLATATLLAGLALFPVLGLHGTLGAELAAEFGVHISADQLLAAGRDLRTALP